MSRDWVTALATFRGMAHSLSRVGQESYFYPRNYYMPLFVHSVEQAAQKINGLPTPFLSQALLIHLPVSLTHMHTLLKHHCFPLCLRQSQRKNGRYILMEK